LQSEGKKKRESRQEKILYTAKLDIRRVGWKAGTKVRVQQKNLMKRV